MGEPHDFMEDEVEPSGGNKKTYHRATTNKRMYRNPDDRILGGVCSGLGAYFNTDPWIFRTLFIVFSIFFLSGIIIYLILWIAIPEAKTSAQKLEMRGEPITVDNIKNAVKNEFDRVKNRMNL
jgi:phage shock protein C